MFLGFLLNISYSFSLRVNLDMAKVTYSWLIGRDPNLPGTVVRSSTIPEELGRISYLLSDKTGTLTKNEMVSHSMSSRVTVTYRNFMLLLALFNKVFCVDKFMFLFRFSKNCIWAASALVRNRSTKSVTICDRPSPVMEGVPVLLELVGAHFYIYNIYSWVLSFYFLARFQYSSKISHFGYRRGGTSKKCDVISFRLLHLW